MAGTDRCSYKQGKTTPINPTNKGKQLIIYNTETSQGQTTYITLQRQVQAGDPINKGKQFL